MKSPPKISETEWEVMRVIWAQHPITSPEILTRLVAVDATWHPKTLRSLLTRLVDKGALDYVARGRTYAYRPIVAEADCVAAASGSFLERVFGGSLKPMLVHFVEQRRLTRKDVEELRGLFDQPRGQPSRKNKRPGSKP